MKNSKVNFICSDEKLNKGFEWAKEQALSYAHDGDKVGKWYEAALPNRNAFCIRDVCHHITGAHYLGLDEHTKNMLSKFVSSIAESRDYCAYWEITKDDCPAPEDYTDDNDFWYNLPANFDLIDGCCRAFKYTDDRDYIAKNNFTSFYKLTFNNYIACWDSDNDSVPNRKVFSSRRGIPSYDEQKGMENAVVAADLIAAQIRAYLSYAEICELTQKDKMPYIQKARKLIYTLENVWWNKENECFYSAKMANGEFVSTLGSPHLLIYFNAVKDKQKLNTLLDNVHNDGLNGVIVELMSHYPEIYFKNGQKKRGLYWLRRCIDPSLERREYPEVSFAAVGAYVEGLMGLKCNAVKSEITSAHNLSGDISYAKLTDCPMFSGTIDYIYENGKYTLINKTGRTILFNNQKVENNEKTTQCISC